LLRDSERLRAFAAGMKDALRASEFTPDIVRTPASE
jgi:hypothetical protein